MATTATVDRDRLVKTLNSLPTFIRLAIDEQQRTIEEIAGPLDIGAITYPRSVASLVEKNVRAINFASLDPENFWRYPKSPV